MARQDVMVATAVATAIAAGALLVGAVFDPARPALVDGRTGSGEGRDLLMPGAPAERFRAVSQGVDGEGLQASIALPPAIGRDRDADAGADGADGDAGAVDGPQTDGGTRDVLRDAKASASGTASVKAPSAASGTTTPAAVDNGPAASAITPAANQDPSPAGSSSRVRLRVIGVAVTGANGGQLQPGSQVRLRLATSSTPTGDPAADQTANAKGANVDESAAPLPEHLDVRLGLDAAAVAALRADTRETNGALALRASVDLVDKPSDNPAGRAPFALRVRMRLLPADTGSKAVTTAEQEHGDGASNVVEVTAPIGDDQTKPGTPSTPGTGTPETPGTPGTPTEPGKPPVKPGTPGTPTDPSTPTDPETPGGTDGAQPGTGEGGATTDPVTPAERQPVEVVLALPSSGTGTIGDGGASVDVPLPDRPASKPDSSAGVDVVVHLPEAEEPLDQDAPTPPATPSEPETPAPGSSTATPGTSDPEPSTTAPTTTP